MLLKEAQCLLVLRLCLELGLNESRGFPMANSTSINLAIAAEETSRKILMKEFHTALWLVGQPFAQPWCYLQLMVGSPDKLTLLSLSVEALNPKANLSTWSFPNATDPKEWKIEI